MSTAARQTIVTLDLEGVLVPEIWIAVAERTGIEALRRTTKDEPDYDALMSHRLGILAEHGLTMSLISDVIGGLQPLPGAQRSSTSSARSPRSSCCPTPSSSSRRH